MSGNSLPLLVPRNGGSFYWPRRQCTDQLVPAEIALKSAVDAVESLGCDPQLTNIVMRLQELRDDLADYLEGTGTIKPSELTHA